jgi:protein involved in polysaccharide export with SLBB domain
MRITFLIMFFVSFGLAQPAKRTVPDGSANLPSQRIGPSDLIAVSIYDAPELSRTIRVGADGYFALPMLKQRLMAKGLYPADLETAISAALRDEEILVNPVVTVTIAEYHSHPISVSGSVKVPLVFQAEGPTTLLEAIARAQGLNADAGREILISRPQPGPDGKSVMLTRRISVRSLFDDADPELNVTLTGGEEIRVPEIGSTSWVTSRSPAPSPSRTVRIPPSCKCLRWRKVCRPSPTNRLSSTVAKPPAPRTKSPFRSTKS